MGAIDWLLLGLIVLAAAFALRRTLRSRGSCSCGGNCASCGQSCTSRQEQQKGKRPPAP
jgi:hypothetical protein